MFRFTTASVLPVLLALITLGLCQIGRQNLAEYVLKNGRMVLAPAQDTVDPEFDKKHLIHLLDCNPETPVYLNYPAEQGEPTYMLIDLGLTHSAPTGEKQNPLQRKALSIIIYNGSCTKCSRVEFQKHSRLKKVKLEILYRQANNVDQDFSFPPVETVFSQQFTFPDQPGPRKLDLSKIELPQASPGWPVNMNYIIAKFVILDIYQGKQPNSKLAIAELTYKDLTMSNSAAKSL